MNIDPGTETWFFHGHGILAEILESTTRHFKEAIDQIPADEYLSLNLDELKQKHIDSLTVRDFPALLLDSKHIVNQSDHKALVEHIEYGQLKEREVRFIRIRMGIAFAGNKRFFLHRPLQAALRIIHVDRDNTPKGYLLENELHFEYDFPEHDTTFLEKHFEHDIELICNYLSLCKSEYDKHNASVPLAVNTAIDGRLAECQKDKQFLQSLKYPLKKQDQVPIAFQLPERRVVVGAIQGTAPKPGSSIPVLANTDYELILEILQSMSIAMERSPKVFCGLEEEEIRDFFLVILNSHFSGKVTGETFNNNGKTDILIRSGDSNIFIAECKFWSGEKLFQETIDQLLGYVTWRDTKTAILVFNRNKNFSSVLAKIKASIVTHPCHISEGHMQNRSLNTETVLPYNFKHKDDPARLLSMTVLAFDIPT
jgi:hypothetical protein